MTNALLVAPGQQEGPGVPTYRRIARWARPYALSTMGVFLVDLLATPVALLSPVPLKIAVDSVVGDRPLPGVIDAVMPEWFEASPTRVLALACALVVIAVAVTQLQDLASYYLRTRVGERMTLNVRTALFRRVQQLSLAYHDARGTSDSIYRIQSDATGLKSATIEGFLPLVASAVTVVSMLYVALHLDWQLALVALTIAPILFTLSHIYKARARRWYRNVKTLESSALKVVQEVLTSLRVVKAFSREAAEEERFSEQSVLGVRARLRLIAAEGFFGVAISLTTAAGTAFVLWFGVHHVLSGVLTLGELLIVMAYIAQLYAPLKTMSRKVGSMQSALASSERVFEVLDHAPDVPERPDARPLGRARGTFRVERVSFSYDGETNVLSNVSFEVPAGSKVGIAGRTGAGKSTLVNLIARFYDPSGGAIYLDGLDLRDYRVTDLRNQFAIVLQDPVLFSTTIGENIAYARPGATQAEIERAAAAADAHDFILGLPGGYDTLVGERGMRLSGGERQRVSLARAFLKDAPILILDEPTSSVDVKTETAIMAALTRLMAGRTTFMIAHRMSTLAGCDIRLDVDAGTVHASKSMARSRGMLSAARARLLEATR